MAKKKKSLSKKHHRESNKLMLILFIVLAFVLVIVYSSFKFDKKVSYSREELVSFVNSSMVTVPDTSFAVSLTDGKGEFSDSVTEGTVKVSEPIYSVKTKAGYDVFAVMTYNTGGSGEFVDIAMFYVIKDKAVFRGSYPVGDRVVVDDITLASEKNKNSYTINVNYLDRTPEESMADEPTEFETLNFEVKDHMIVTPLSESEE